MPYDPKEGMAVEPDVYEFDPGPDQLDKLSVLLDRIEDDTVVDLVEHPGQVLLTPELVVQTDGSRLSWLAVYQVCRAAGPALSTVVADLAGRRIRTDGLPTQAETAALVYNAAVRLRFDGAIARRQVVRSVTNRTIEAIVGPGYRRLPNRDFLLHLRDVVRRSPGAMFAGALLVGRRLVVRYAFPALAAAEEHFELGAAVPGLAFTNSEVGDASVRAAPGVQFRIGWVAASARAEDRVKHAGRGFYAKMGRLLETNCERVRSPVGVVARLSSLSLGFSGNRDKDRNRLKQLRRRLTEGGLQAILAGRVVRRVARQGEDADDVRTRQDASVADLLVAAVTESVGYPASAAARDLAGRAAYRLFTFRGQDYVDDVPLGGEDERTIERVP